MASKYTKFKELLKQKLIFSEQYNVRDVARKINISPSSLYHYAEDAQNCPNFPVDLLAPLFNATKDIDFLNFILADTDFMLAPRQQTTEQKSVKDETLEAAAAGGILVKHVCEALRDNILSDEEKKTIAKAIDGAELELEDLRHCVRHSGGNGTT